MNSIKIWIPYCIVTISGQNKKRHAIVTIDDRIVDIDESDNVLKKYMGANVLYLKNAIILPGFIDCHTHFELTNLHKKVYFDNLFDLMSEAGKWHKSASPKEIAYSCKMGQYASVRNGIIYSLDWRTQCVEKKDYLFPDNVTVAFEIIETKHEMADKKLKEKIQELRQFYNIERGCFLAPHSLYMVSKTLWNRLLESEYPLTTHIAESVSEIEWLSTKKGRLYEHCTKKSSIAALEGTTFSPMEKLQEYGQLKEKTLFVHGTFLTKSEMKLINDKNCFLCLCPSSNLQLTGKIVDFSNILENQVDFLIGTDSIGARYDLLFEIRLLLNNFNKYCNNHTAKKLLKSITIEAAKALNIMDDYGSVDVGKKASFNIVSFDKPIKTSSLELEIIMNGRIQFVVLNGEIVI